MKNLIPEFIIKNTKSKKYKGHLSAYVLYMDITGFTLMTDQLLKSGRDGAETLSCIMNRIFEPVIDIILSYNGFITTFAGDGFTALFESSRNSLEILACINDINTLFEKIKIQETTSGDFLLNLKSGIAFGPIKWRIIGQSGLRSFYFSGTAIDDSINASLYSGINTISLHESFKNQLPDHLPVKYREKSYYTISRKDNFIQKVIPEFIEYPADCLSDYIPQTILNSKLQGEFREVVSLFISINPMQTDKKIDNIILDIIHNTNQYGGYFNKVDYGDKGLLLIIFFGAPQSFENDLDRAIDFSLHLYEKYRKSIKIGINAGLAYAGLVGSYKRCEYTCLGEVVNQSSALIQAAQMGEILINQQLSNKICKYYQCRDSGLKKIKGKSGLQKVYQITGKIQDNLFIDSPLKLFGRSKDLSTLKQFTNQFLTQKNHACIFIHGDGGMGKSILIKKLLAEFQDDTMIISLPPDQILSKSLYPFITFIKDLFRINDYLSQEKKRSLFLENYQSFLDQFTDAEDDQTNKLKKELIRTRSVIAGLIDIHIPGSLYNQLEPKARYENTLPALSVLFQLLSFKKPLILLLDDFQWIDQSSLDFLHFFIPKSKENQILFIFSSRYDDEGQVNTKLQSEWINAINLELKRLNDADIFKMISNILGAPADQKLISRISGLSENNPFFIEQLCYFLKENHYLEIYNNQYRLLKQDHSLPNDISSIMISRIDRLTEELKEIIQIASVLGKEIEVNTLKYMIRIYQKELFPTDDYLNLKFLEIEHQQIWLLLNNLKYLFKHSLLHETLYEMQLRERLRSLHLLAAQSIENLYPDIQEKFADLAYHYDKAQQKNMALSYYLQTIEFHINRFENERALHCLNRIFELSDDISSHYELLSKKAQILNTLGKWDEESDFLNHWIDFMKKNQNYQYLPELLSFKGIIHRNRNQFDEAFNSFYQALDYAEKTDNDKQIGVAYGHLGIVHLNLCEYTQAIEFFEKKISIAKKLKDISSVNSTIGNIGIVYWNMGDYSKAMECYELQKTYSESLNDKNGLSLSLGNMGLVYMTTGKYERAMECLTEKMKICEEIGDVKGLSNAVGNLGTVYWNQGDFDKALNSYQYWQETCENLGDKAGYSYATGNIGLIYYTQGQYEKAKINLEKWKEGCLQCDDKSGLSSACGNLALLYWDTGDYDKSMENFEIDRKICEDLGDEVGLSITIGNIGSMHLEKGEFEEAIECFEFRKKISEKSGDQTGLSVALCYLANAAKYMGQYDLAETLYSQAITLGKKHGQKYYLSDFYQNYTDLMIHLEKYDLADKYNKMSRKLASEIDDKNMLFQCKVTEIHLLGIKNPNKAEREFLSLLPEYQEYEKLALLYYELFSIKPDSSYKDQAISIYTRLYERIPKYLYQKRLSELNA